MATNQITELKNKVQVVKKESKDIRALIQDSITELGRALPAHMNPERMARIALTTMRLNPKLMDCNPQSFLGALFQCAQLGLEPNIDGQAYIIPYTNSKKVDGLWVKTLEAQFQIGYKGFVELFYRHEKALSLDMHAVHENDVFEYEYGTSANLKHCPVLKDRGAVIAYYVVVKLNNGGTIFNVMTKDECVNHGKKHSKCVDKASGQFNSNTPWATDLDAMCMKTVLIQLMKVIPKSVEIQKALATDNTTKTKIDVDMFAIKDETNWADVIDVEQPEKATQVKKVAVIQEYAEEEI